MLNRSSLLSVAVASLALLVVNFDVAHAQTTYGAAAVDPTCPMDCKADGTCVRGNADFAQFASASTENSMPFLKDANMGGYHCECPAGRTGLFCEREYENCGDGKHYCFHGGQCMSGLTDEYGNDQFFCDCKAAVHEGVNYAGKFCQAEAVDVCGDAAEYGNVFCTNGGVCRDNFVAHLDQPCVCQEGWEGPHCEYKQGQAPGCDLKCENGGHPRIGSKDYPPNALYNEFWKTSEDHCFCLCPPGFFGLTCSIQGEECGDDHCFNGGTCQTQEIAEGSPQTYCDCTTANTAGSTSYAGRYCEAESTSFCSKMADQNGHQFCVNGGSCKADSHLGCDCLEGFSGPICEFRDSVVQDTECNLKCQNNGVCRNGAKDIGFLKKFNLDVPSTDTAFSDDFEHCVCPRGYVGLNCEHQVMVCPGGEQVCMNGADCLPDDSTGRLQYECDCDSIRLPFDKYTGDFCELKSSELCTYNGRPGEGLNNDAFCVNGGRCKAHANEKQGHPGCTCPVGFEGDHCESLSGERNPNVVVVEDDETDDDGGLSTAGIIAIVLFVDLLVLGAIGAYIYQKRQRQQREVESEFGHPKNLMADRDDDEPHQGPPTLDNILSMASMPDGSDSSILDDSRRSGSHTSSVDGDGIYRVEEQSGPDLVNVAII